MSLTCYIAIQFLLLMCEFYVGRARISGEMVQIGAEENEPYNDVLTHEAFKERELIGCVFFLLFGFLTFSSQPVLIGTLIILLAICSFCDIRSNMVSDLFLVPAFFVGCQIGLDDGKRVYILMIAVMFLMYVSGIGDSDAFGGADAMVMLSVFAALGFFYGLIALISACIIGIFQKLGLWLTRTDRLSERGVAFVPALTMGYVIALISSITYGDVISLRFSDLQYLWQYLWRAEG